MLILSKLLRQIAESLSNDCAPSLVGNGVAEPSSRCEAHAIPLSFYGENRVRSVARSLTPLFCTIRDV